MAEAGGVHLATAVHDCRLAFQGCYRLRDHGCWLQAGRSRAVPCLRRAVPCQTTPPVYSLRLRSGNACSYAVCACQAAADSDMLSNLGESRAVSQNRAWTVPSVAPVRPCSVVRRRFRVLSSALRMCQHTRDSSWSHPRRSWLTSGLFTGLDYLHLHAASGAISLFYGLYACLRIAWYMATLKRLPGPEADWVLPALALVTTVRNLTAIWMAHKHHNGKFCT